MEPFINQYITVSPSAQNWAIELRTFPSISGRSVVASISKNSIMVDDQETAEKLAKLAAEQLDITYVPTGSSVIVAGPIGNCYVPMKLTADGQVLGMGTAQESLEKVMIQVKKVAEKKGLPWVKGAAVQNDENSVSNSSDSDLHFINNSSGTTRLWSQVITHSNDICRLLELSKADLEKIEDLHDGSFLEFEVEGEKFALHVMHSCGCPYGGDWEYMVQVSCTSNGSLNNATGVGTTFINSIPDEWHQKLLDTLDSDVRTQLHKEINSRYQDNQTVWSQVESYSSDYCSRLALSTADLELIDDFIQDCSGCYPSLADHGRSSFLDFEVEGKKFALYVKHTCGCSYGGEWEKLIQVCCTNDPSLNNSTGGGTTLINSIPEEWHQKILNQLTDEIKSQLHDQIETVSSRNKRLWNQVQENSQKYSEALDLTKMELKSMERVRKKISVTVEDKEFIFYPCNTCGCPYGGDWKIIIQARCKNDPELNESTGMGTTHLNVISPEWHQKLLEALRMQK